MIVSAELQFKWQRRVRRKDALQFDPGLNTLAGPNGSGKSTIIQALLDGGDCRLQFEGSSEIRLFDTERMNPRVLAIPAATPAEMALRLRGSFSSHGQIIRQTLAALPAGPRGMTLLVDQPEAGQDYEAVQRIKATIDAACEQGYQFIVASHHPVFWFGTHLIELQPGYTRQVLTALAALH